MGRHKEHPRALLRAVASTNRSFSNSSSSSSSSSSDEDESDMWTNDPKYIQSLIKGNKSHEEIVEMKRRGAFQIIAGHDGLIREPPINYILRYLTNPNVLNRDTFLTHELEFATETIEILNILLYMPYRFMTEVKDREALVDPLTAIIYYVSIAQRDHQPINYRNFIGLFYRLVMLGANPNTHSMWIVKDGKKSINRDFSGYGIGGRTSLFCTLFSCKIPPEIIIELIELTNMIVPNDFNAQFIVNSWCLSVEHIRAYAVSSVLRPVMPEIMQEVRHIIFGANPYRILPEEYAAMQFYFPPLPQPPNPWVSEE